MKKNSALLILSILVALLAIVQSGMGLFWKNEGSSFEFTTLHGETVLISGQGLYSYDTFFRAPIFRGTDAVMLFAGIPLLIAGILLYRKGSLRGGLFLTCILSVFLYNSASVAFGVAYNNLFLVYTAYFSASLFAFILAVRSIDIQGLANRVTAHMPHTGIAILLFVAGAAVMFAWLSDVILALVNGGVPAIASYTTEVTYVIDIGIIAPLSALAGILLLKRSPMGYLLASILLVNLALIGLIVSVQTLFQLSAGITLTPGEFIGKAGSFMVLSLIAVWMIVRFFANISEKPALKSKTRPV